MPRAKTTPKQTKKVTNKQNGVGKSLKTAIENEMITSVNDKIVNGEEKVDNTLHPPPLAVAAKGRARGKKAIEIIEQSVQKGGRRRKDVTDTPADNAGAAEVQAVAAVQAAKPKGRSKKAAAAAKDEIQPLIVEPSPSRQIKAKPRIKRPTAAAAAEIDYKQKDDIDEIVVLQPQPIKALNAVGKGRKKKKETPMPDAVSGGAEINSNRDKSLSPIKQNINKKTKAISQSLNTEEDIEKNIVASPKVTPKKAKAGKVLEKPKKEIKIVKSKSKKQAVLVEEEEEEVPPIVEKPIARGRKRGNADTAAVANAEAQLEASTEATVNKSPRRVGKAVKPVNVTPTKKIVKNSQMQAEKKAPQRGRKRQASTTGNDEKTDDSKPSKSKKKAIAIPLNPTDTTYNKSDFDLPPPEGAKANNILNKRYNLKISSWNVSGLRSWIKKDGLKFLEYEEPDILCLQETKCTTDQLPEEATRINGYHPYWLCMAGGYAGVAIYSKIMPIHVEYGIGNEEFDEVGRIITAEYEKFYLLCTYVPNSGRKLVNLEARMRWEELFHAYVQKLDALKAVIIVGDMNVSHEEIDLANPKSNTRSAGFTKEEREKMTKLLSLGFTDTFRHLYPTRTGAYTYWTYIGNARSRNVGWRLDYFIVSDRLIDRLVESCIRSQCKGSDHCPITLFLNL